MRNFHFVIVHEEDGAEAINKAYEVISGENVKDNLYRYIASISPQNEITYELGDEANNRKLIAENGLDSIEGINSFIRNNYINIDTTKANEIVSNLTNIQDLSYGDFNELTKALDLVKPVLWARSCGADLDNFNVLESGLDGYNFESYGVTHADYQDYELPQWVVIVEVP